MTARSCDRCDQSGKHICVPRAARVVDVFQTLLCHTKGRWARAPFVLTKWQRDDIIVPLFGTTEWSAEWDRWVRSYRLGWIEVARKNGKSELLAGIALVLLCADDEEGAEIYGCACDRGQARKVFDVAQRMVELNPVLSKRLTVYRHSRRMVYAKTGSYYEVVAADAAGNLGHNPHGVIFDEVLTQPSRELWDAFTSSLSAREQPLMVAATTAGDDPVGLCASEHEYTLRCMANKRLDPRRFGYIRNTPADADPHDPKVWKLANPALGDFKSLGALRDESRRARHNPAALKAFRQFELNTWGTEQASSWVDLARWDECKGEPVDLTGMTAYGGLDLASTTDLAAWCLVFPLASAGEETRYAARWRLWAPQARLRSLDDRTAGAASTWVRNGWLTVTQGDVIDYHAILTGIDEDAQRYDVMEVAYDRWGMTQMSQDLTDAGMTVIPFGQGFGSMSPPTKELEGLIMAQRFDHGGNPAMRWMIDNVRIRTDPAGNVKMDRGRSADKIDGAIACVMALDRALRHTVKKRSYAAASF